MKYFISLRTKMLLAMAAGMLLLFGLIFFVARNVLLEGYSKLEADKTNIQINSAISLLNEQSEQLSAFVRDNAHWDDMYRYTLKQDHVFIESNFPDAAFANAKVNATLIVNNEGEILFKKGMDYKNGQPWRIPELLLQATKKGGVLFDPAKESVSGLFWTAQGICIVSAFDILDSNNKGLRRGRLIMVRRLDQTLKQHMSEMLGASIAVEGMRDDEIAFISPKLANNEKVVLPVNTNQVGGFALIDAVGGDTKLVLSTVGDRKIFEQGQSSLKFLYWASALAALLLGAFSWLLDRLVLKRLKHLNKNVIRIGESATTSGRVKDFSGNDEMSSLAHGINGMLLRLDESQRALQFEKERAQVTLAGIADAVITSNDQGLVVYMNEAAERLTGINIADATGKSLQSLFHLVAEDNTPLDSAWLTDANSALEEVALARADGQTFVIRKSTSPLYDYNSVLFGNVTVLHDVSILRALSNRLSYQAHYDSLTGLVNRYEFDRKAQAAIEDARASNSTHCLAYIDLDEFKIINDTCGHLAGDLLLKQLADQMATKVRSSDTLARLGGDEFALLLTGCSLEKAQKIVNDLLTTIQDYCLKFNGKIFKVEASIGLTEITTEHGLNLSELLVTVDSACYAAKREGGNRVHVYHADDDNSGKNA